LSTYTSRLLVTMKRKKIDEIPLMTNLDKSPSNDLEASLKDINENQLDNTAENEKKNSLNQFRAKYFSQKLKE
jgi:hypothetical protein